MGIFILLVIAFGSGIWIGLRLGGYRALYRLGRTELGERRKRSGV